MGCISKALIRALALLFVLTCITGAKLHGDDAFYFLEKGVLLALPSESEELTVLGSFAPDAFQVCQGPRGRLWGMLQPNLYAALEPDSGRLAARIRLPHKGYHHLIAANGKAYVVHHVLTKQGFSVSVVDTELETHLAEIFGIQGLGTSLVRESGFVYLATIGVGQEDYLFPHLYRIDTRTDRLREIHRYGQRGHFWRLAVHGSRLFILYLPAETNGRESFLEEMDLESLEILRRVSSSQLLGEARNLRRIAFSAGQAFVVSRTAEGTEEIGISDFELSKAGNWLQVPGTVRQILGIRSGAVLVLCEVAQSGARETWLLWLDLEAGRKLRSVNVSRFVDSKKN
jgi:hypothetical protein